MDRPTQTHVRTAGLQPVQLLAGLTGLVFLVVGIAGLVRTGFGGFTDPVHSTMWTFTLNPLVNVVHIVAGLIALLAAFRSGLARMFGWLLFAGFGLLVAWGLAITGVFATNPVDDLGNPLALGTAQNWLHFGGALAALLMAMLPARKRVMQTERPAEPEPTPADETTTTERSTRRRPWSRRTASHG